MSASAQLPRPGDTIGGSKYMLDRLIGQGGMGAVFAGRHLKLSKAVAIKIMLADPSNPEASHRFINEGRAAANIQNEHVVRVDDVDEEMGYAYMVLELLDGQDLAQVLEASPSKRIAPHVAVGWVIQGLRGVAQAHALGIVHRDLKPSNLFLAKRKDGSAVVKVLDFGISKATNQSGLNQAVNALTSTKAMLGSPLYMSPEQLRNAKSVDHRADIWAMGIILYELITGALPFMGDNLGELFAAILESDPQPLRQRAGDAVPHGLNDVVMRCLQRKPEQRFQSAAELMQALAPFEQPMPGAGTSQGLGALGGTAFLPNGNISNAQAQAQVAQAISQNSNTGPQPAPPGTPSGPRLATASQPNLTPPQFVHTTGSGWQQNSNVAGLPKSKLPILLGVFGAVALIGSVLAVAGWKAMQPKDDVTGHPPPPVVSSSILAVEVPPSAVVSAKPPEPPPETSASTAASTPAPAPAPQPAVQTPTHRPNNVPVRPQPAPQPQPAQPTPQPSPSPVVKPNGGGKQPNYEDHR